MSIYEDSYKLEPVISKIGDILLKNIPDLL